MSVIPPPFPLPKPLPKRDSIGRQQEICKHCGDRITLSNFNGFPEWLHPDKGYSTFCEEPKRATPKNQQS